MRLIAIFSMVLFACSPPTMDKESQKIVKEELESRRIIKATEGDILSAAHALGNAIADSSQKALASELMNALKEKGFAEAIEYCNLEAVPLVDSLGKQYKATIKRTSLKVRNTENNPSGPEYEILEAYQYSHDHNQPLKENVQMMGNDIIVFTKPIMVANAMCLNCHGTPDKEIKPENHSLLKKLYPDDAATGYSMGDFRGMWSIRFHKKDIIKSL